jgi:hypothetical protein
VVTGFTVIVFIIIAVLDDREKKQKKRSGELTFNSASAEGSSPEIDHGSEKKLPLGDEEDVNRVIKE